MADGRVAPGSFTPRPSSPGESHPEALTDPCLSLSAHTARAIHGELAPSLTTRRFLPLPVDQGGHDANGLPPSLRGHYSTSQLIRGSPPLADALVLWASRFVRLCLLPSHRQRGSQVPYESPDWTHAASAPDTARPVSRHLPCFSRTESQFQFWCHLLFRFDALSSDSLSLVFPIPT